MRALIDDAMCSRGRKCVTSIITPIMRFCCASSSLHVTLTLLAALNCIL